MTACATSPKTETVVVVPDLSFPDYPDPEGNVELDDADGTVTMSLEYYTLIYEFKVKVDETKAVYNRIKSSEETRGVK